MIDSPEHEDIDFEPEDELGSIGAVKAKLQKLREELDKVKAERQEYLDGWQRCKADAINAKKDALAAGERQAQRRIEDFIECMLPALDSFDMAAASEAWATIDKGWRTGMEQVQNQLLDTLSRAGVQRFGKIGEVFDHVLHEAVEERDDVAGEPGTIVRVLRRGYKSGERILRPAQVIVKK
jgi:molecular chaperone GrpE